MRVLAPCSSSMLSSLVAKLRGWLYHSAGPFICNCFLTSSASLYTFLLKHPFRTVITLSRGNSTAPLLISGVFSCHDLPCHFKVNVPWSLWGLGLLHPHCLYIQVQVYLLPSSNQGERISSLQLLRFRQLFCTAAAIPLCFYQSKKCVFLLASSIFCCDFVPFWVFS